MTSWPFSEVLVWGRFSTYVDRHLCERRRCEREGISSGGEWFEFGRSSPSRHCPQKTVVVHARTAASKLELGSRLS